MQPVAIVTFTIENAKGSPHEFATERFAELVLAAQPGVEILELGDMAQVRRRAVLRRPGREGGFGFCSVRRRLIPGARRAKFCWYPIQFPSRIKDPPRVCAAQEVDASWSGPGIHRF